jgi:hypothetical protein
MSRILTLLITLCAGAALAQAQDQRSPLDRAYDDVRAADLALRAAEAKRDQAEEPRPGERSATATGFSRLNENYFARQISLDQEVAAARKRYDDALKRWNDLK